VVIKPLPILRNHSGGSTQELAGQPRHSGPRQERKRVCRLKGGIPARRSWPSSDEPVAWSQMPRGRRPRQTGDRRPPRINQVLKVLPDRLSVGQVMMGLHQTAKQCSWGVRRTCRISKAPNSPRAPGLASSRSRQWGRLRRCASGWAADGAPAAVGYARPGAAPASSPADHAPQSPIGLNPIPECTVAWTDHGGSGPGSEQ